MVLLRSFISFQLFPQSYRKIFFIPFAWCILGVLAKAQNSEINCDKLLQGKVIDGENKKPIEGAVIVWPCERKSVASGARGNFKLENLCIEEGFLLCQYAGFKELKINIHLAQATDLLLVLHADTCLLESVVIVGEKKSVAVLQESQLKGTALDRTRGLSLGQTLQEIPGVFAVQTGPSIFKPVIQGVYGQRVLIMNNGVRQEGQQWGSEHAPEVDPFVASKITVVKGAQSVRYGADAIGGVILVDAPPLRKTGGIDAEVNLVGLSNNRQGVASGIINYATKHIPGLSFRLQGTLKKAGNTRTPNYWLDNTGYQEQNFSWAVGYQRKRFGVECYYSQFNTTIGIFTGSHFGDTTDLAAAMRRDVPNVPSVFSYQINRPYQLVEHELWKAKGHWNIGNNIRLELDYARQFNYRAEFDTDRPYNNSLRGLPEMKFGITTHTSNLALQHQLLSSIKGTVGISMISQANTARSTVGSFFIPNFESYAGGIYLIEAYRNRNWEIEAGVRYDYKWMRSYLFRRVGNTATFNLVTPELVFQQPSFSLGIGWQVNSFLKLKSNFATGFRAPTVAELYSNGVHHGVNTFERGDSTLKKEVAYSANVSAAVQLSKFFAEVTLYHNYIHNYIFLQPMAGQYIVSIRGATPLFEYKQVDATFTGIDGLVSDSLFRNVVYTGKFSMLRAHNITTNEGLLLTPTARISNGLTLHAKEWKWVERPFLTINHLLVPRKAYVPVNGDFKAPPKGYGLINLDMGFETRVQKQKVQFTFSINNLLNTRYRDYLDRFRYFNDAAGINFVVRLKVLLGK